MALSFTEKRGLQKTISTNLSALAAGGASFQEKRRMQKEISDALVKLGQAAPDITPEPTEAEKAVKLASDFFDAMNFLKNFIGTSQLSAISSGAKGEEKQFFMGKMVELAATIKAMPETYQTDGNGDKASVVLHYFNGGSDWYITEKDKGGPDDENPGEQLQAFGYAILNGDTQNAESGYISIKELIQNGVELDLYWTPKTLAAIKGKSDGNEPQTDGNQKLIDLQTGKFNDLDPMAFLGVLKDIATEINDIEPLKAPAIAYIQANQDKVNAVMESAMMETFGKLWDVAGRA